jgi:23S rRNA pseudouridine955/2504/2580 synthase
MSAETRIVGRDDTDIRLDRWFQRHLPDVPHGMLVKWLRTGQVRVDGKRAEAGTRLFAGSELRIPPVPALAPPKPREAVPVSDSQARDLRKLVLYQDHHVLVLDKPFGLPVQGGPGITKHLDGMLDALAFDGERPRLVHRLDRDTTGVLVLGRTAAAASKLAAAFRGRDAEKTYWAVVAGRPVPVEGKIDLALDKSGPPGSQRVAPRADGAQAVTLFRTMDHAARKLAWLELNPLTGRTHQLRVHCAAIGAPILGDSKYGGAASRVAGLSQSLHLHARAIDIAHPAGGRLVAEAALPPHMQATFRELGFSAPKPKGPGVQPRGLSRGSRSPG